MNAQHYYDLLMKSFEDAIRAGSGIIDLAQCRAIEGSNMPKQDTPVKPPVSDKKSNGKKTKK